VNFPAIAVPLGAAEFAALRPRVPRVSGNLADCGHSSTKPPPRAAREQRLPASNEGIAVTSARRTTATTSDSRANSRGRFSTTRSMRSETACRRLAAPRPRCCVGPARRRARTRGEESHETPHRNDQEAGRIQRGLDPEKPRVRARRAAVISDSIADGGTPPR
jgi:hypothetical protein